MTMANCLRRSSRHTSASTISTRRCTDSGSCANRDLKIASIASEMSTATTDTPSRASGTVRRPDPAPISSISGDLVTVKVVFAQKLARYIRERLWHPSQKFRDLTDGRLELTLHVADTLEVRRWILGYGVQAEVIEPAGMREALRQEAEALADRLAPQRKPLAAA